MESRQSGPASEPVDNNDSGSSTKSRSKSRAKKRKREPSGSSDEDNVLPENTLEIEKNLHALAIKNNLDEDSVKKILKKVVTNDHVLAYVALREEEEDSSTEVNHVPKLTRSKVKELKKGATGKQTWNLENLELTPIKHIPVKTRPEVKALIAQELPEDEDDDEYEPTHDDVPSDDDQTLESCSDLDSQPRTPATPKQSRSSSPRIVKDGPFKVPQDMTPARRKLNMEKEEAEPTIALRTRSKLSLSATPIEHIESSFVPPDELPMPAVDDLWNQFLTECLDPAPTVAHEDEDETDPEYNVAADPDAHDEDEEALENSIIKISKKELNDLVTELFSIMPESSEDVLLAENMAKSVLSSETTSQPTATSNWEGKREPPSDDESRGPSARRISDRITFERRDSNSTSFSIGKTEPGTEPEEEPVYLEIGGIPVSTEANPRNAEAVKEVSVAQSQNQAVLNDVVYVNAPVLNVLDVNPVNIVNVVVGQQAKTVTIPLTNQDAPKVPIPVQRHHTAAKKKRASVRQKTKITRVEVHMNSERCILPEQVIILQQQIRMHVQLATSNYMQLYVHPLNYGFGPTYKDFLVTLSQLAEKTPNSVADVCNLKPALELIAAWENKLCESTPENTAFIQFIQDDCVKWERYLARHNYYSGDFHNMFKKAVAESNVFLYPYLLPPRPYHNRNRRSSYLTSEDDLIAMGLDQFWQFVLDNPKLYPTPKTDHTRRRWWLNATLELISKHMLPFLNVRMLLSHIHNARKDPDSPVRKFFETGVLTEVQHRILPFNPTATLYDQPVEEMPRLWLKYLAKNEPRFRKYMNSRHKNQAGAPPIGIPIKVNLDPNAPIMKPPLPTDFTKKIVTRRKKKTTGATTTDAQSDTTNNPQTTDKSKTNQTIDNNTNLQTPEGVATNITNIDPLVTANIFKLEDTSTGQRLVPLIIQVNAVDENPTPSERTASIGLTDVPSDNESDNPPKMITKTPNTYTNTIITKTVNCNRSPITSSRSNTITTTTVPIKVLPISNNSTHCKCCSLLRKICKRQTRITEYFAMNVKSCFCKEMKHPDITRKLIQLVNSFKDPYRIAMENLTVKWAEAEEARSKALKKKRRKRVPAVKVNKIEQSTSTDAEDLSYVINYKMKLMARLGPNIDLKFKVHSIFSKFDSNSDDPLTLAQSLYEVLTGHHSALFRDFLAFLTAEQAARMGKFRDYFALVRIGELVKMVEEEIEIGERRLAILEKLFKMFSRDGVVQPAACEMCSALLPTFNDHPRLAQRFFQLFPHNIAQEEKRVESDAPPSSSQTCEQDKTVLVSSDDELDEVMDCQDGPDRTEPDNAPVPLPPQTVEPASTSTAGQGNSPQPTVEQPANSASGQDEELNTSGSTLHGETSQDKADVTLTNDDSQMQDYEADHSSSGEEYNHSSDEVTEHERTKEFDTDEDSEEQTNTDDDEEDVTNTESNLENDKTNNGKDETVIEVAVKKEYTENNIQVLISDVKSEKDSDENSVQDNPENNRNTKDSDSEFSMVIDSDDGTIKSESEEWKREDDKLILQVIRDNLALERGDKPILKFIEDKHVIDLLSESLVHKAPEEIRDRIIYLLQMLLKSEQ